MPAPAALGRLASPGRLGSGWAVLGGAQLCCPAVDTATACAAGGTRWHPPCLLELTSLPQRGARPLPALPAQPQTLLAPPAAGADRPLPALLVQPVLQPPSTALARCCGAGAHRPVPALLVQRLPLHARGAGRRLLRSQGSRQQPAGAAAGAADSCWQARHARCWPTAAEGPLTARSGSRTASWRGDAQRCRQRQRLQAAASGCASAAPQRLRSQRQRWLLRSLVYKSGWLYNTQKGRASSKCARRIRVCVGGPVGRS